MAQRPTTDGSALSAAEDSREDPQDPRPSPELRNERSRFSRLLARFGLGELTDPILRPNDARGTAAADHPQ